MNARRIVLFSALVVMACGGAERPAPQITIDPATLPSLDAFSPSFTDKVASPRLVFATAHGERFNPNWGLPRWLEHDGFRVEEFPYDHSRSDNWFSCTYFFGNCGDTRYWQELYGAKVLVISDPEDVIEEQESFNLLSYYVKFGGSVFLAFSRPEAAATFLKNLGLQASGIPLTAGGKLAAPDVWTSTPAVSGVLAGDTAPAYITAGESFGFTSPERPPLPR